MIEVWHARFSLTLMRCFRFGPHWLNSFDLLKNAVTVNYKPYRITQQLQRASRACSIRVYGVDLREMFAGCQR